MAVLFPRYINIRRGQVICAIIGGWALCPWEILASAIGFLNFMSAYSIFLGPFAGMIATDYYLVRKGLVDVPALYDPQGRYRYSAGVNWRAALALLVSVPPNMPGLIHAINPKVPIGGAQRVFDFGWIFGVSIALLYQVLWKAGLTSH
jgi:NCS1 family nucleobase:cation symporter-1